MSRDDDYRRRDSRDDDRGRDRDRDERPRSRSRDDDDDRPRSRSRDDDSRDSRDSRGRDRDDDRGRDRGGRDSGRRSSFVYERRNDEETARRADVNSKFDKYIHGDVKIYKPRDGENHIRILPPTWKGAKHFGYDLWVHYGVGADRQTYLCLQKMHKDALAFVERTKADWTPDGSDPVEDECSKLRRDGYEKEAKEAAHRMRVGVYLIDRKAESEGVQFWPMPQSVDREIVQHSKDRRTGAILTVDHPEDGYDIFFTKKGKEKNTDYSGVDVDRSPSPLDNNKALDWAMDHPIPEMLIFYSYDHINNMLGGGGGHTNRREERDDDDRGRDRDRDVDDSRRGGRDDSSSSRDSRDDGGRGRDRDDDSRRGSRDDDRERERDSARDMGRERSSGRDRSSRDDDEPTWESVHAMRPRELEDLIEDRRLDINPKEAKDDEDLADWVCDELGLKKAEAPARRSMADDADDDRRSKMDRLRAERSRD